MDIKIQHHNLKRHEIHQYDELNMKEIVHFTDMPKYLSVSCGFMEYIDIHYDRLIVFLTDMPGRIDYDGYLNTLYILSTEEVGYCRKPYCIIPKRQIQSSTLWELGEREQVTLEEVGEYTL